MLDGICLLALAPKALFKAVHEVKSELNVLVRHRHILYYLLHVFHSFAIYLLVCHLPCLPSPSSVPMQARVISSKHRGPLRPHLEEVWAWQFPTSTAKYLDSASLCTAELRRKARRGGGQKERVRVCMKDRMTFSGVTMMPNNDAKRLAYAGSVFIASLKL